MKRIKTWLAVLGLLAAFLIVAPASANAAPYCGITWGSLAKGGGTLSPAPITNVRAGRNSCFDRLVVDIKGPRAGYRVSYVSAVRGIGSGKVIPLRGAADLQIAVLNPAYYSNGKASYTPANPNELINTAGYSTFRQVAYAGSFENHTVIGLGVRSRLPFRVFTLSGPGNLTRLVIDVAHRW